MAAYEIDCINKDDRYNIYERITNIGGPDNGSGRWRVTVAAAINGMRTHGWTFYVIRGGYRVNVEISRGPSGQEYLKTEPDATGANNLLSLRECP
jgi:hypothetical protein